MSTLEELPCEILGQILVEVVGSCSMAGLRKLGLVCKTFRWHLDDDGNAAMRRAVINAHFTLSSRFFSDVERAEYDSLRQLKIRTITNGWFALVGTAREGPDYAYNLIVVYYYSTGRVFPEIWNRAGSYSIKIGITSGQIFSISSRDGGAVIHFTGGEPNRAFWSAGSSDIVAYEWSDAAAALQNDVNFRMHRRLYEEYSGKTPDKYPSIFDIVDKRSHLI